MHRVFVFVLALVLMPSIVMASTYRCSVDETTRSSCCCPEAKRAVRDGKRAERIGSSIVAACCCTVTHSLSVASERTSTTPGLELHPQIVATVVPVPPFVVSSRSIQIVDRPRAQGDPPTSLFARRCLLLI